MLYVISYDLTGENRHEDYNAIADALERAGAARVLFSQWALKSNITSVDRLKSMMLRLTRLGDRVLVVRVADFSGSRLMADIDAIT